MLYLNFSSFLGSLDLGLNNFTLSIFSWLFNFSSNLVELYLNHNNLSGPIWDDFVGFMKNMEVLDLSNNLLNGTVSDIHFDNLANLQRLDLSFNSLTLKFAMIGFLVTSPISIATFILEVLQDGCFSKLASNSKQSRGSSDYQSWSIRFCTIMVLDPSNKITNLRFVI